MQHVMDKNIVLEGKASEDSVDRTSLAKNTSWEHTANANSVDSCAGCSWLLCAWETIVLVIGTMCAHARGRLWFFFLIYPRSYFCSLKPSYLLYLARILECLLG